MKINSQRTTVSFCALFFMACTAFAGDVYVISHPSVTLTAADIKDVFLGEKQLSGAVKLVPVDNQATQEEFLGKVINMDKTKYNNVWVKKGFRDGLAAPQIKFNDAEVINFVKSTPGAVGYVGVPASGVTSVKKY